MVGSRVPLVLLLVGITLHMSPAVAWPQANEVALDGMSFVKDFTEAVTGVLDDEIAALEAKQRGNAGWQPGDQQRLDELRDQRRKAAGCQPAWQAFSTAKTFATMFKEMEAKVSGIDKWQPTMKVSVDEHLGAELNAALGEEIAAASTGVELFTKARSLKKLADTFGQIQQQYPDPEVQRMHTGLGSLFWVFANLGDKLPDPFIGMFVKCYGEAGTSCLGALRKIDGLINQHCHGVLSDDRRCKYPDDRVEEFFTSERYADLRAQTTNKPNVVIRRVPGLRDCYYAGTLEGVLFWDPDRGAWYHADDVSREEATRRYLWCARYGHLGPTVDEILGRKGRLIGVTLTPARNLVPPGEKVDVTLSATTMMGDPVPELTEFLLESRADTLGDWFRGTGWGTAPGSFTDGDPIGLGGSKTWVAPGEPDNMCRITARLAADEQSILAGEPFCLIATAHKAKIVAKAGKPELEVDDSAWLEFKLVTEDGAGLSDRVRGPVAVISDHLTLGDDYKWDNESKTKGKIAYYAFTRPGDYEIVVRFGGYADTPSELRVWDMPSHLLWGMNVMPCQASVPITVMGAAGAGAYRGTITQWVRDALINNVRGAVAKDGFPLVGQPTVEASEMTLRIEGDEAMPTQELRWYLEWNFQNAEGAQAKDSWAVNLTLLPGEKSAEGTFRGPLKLEALKYGVLDVGAMAPEGAQWEAEVQRDGSCLVFLSAPGQTRGNAIYRLEAAE